MTDRPPDTLLAIDGGQPTFPEGPPIWPGAAQFQASLGRIFEGMVLDGSWAQYHGTHTERLTESIRKLTQQSHVRLCSSGTIAVELALRGLGIGSGDEVIIGGYDFPGNFRAIEAVGAKPVLVDIHPTTGCIDVTQIPAACSPTTRCVLVSHLHGGLANMRSLMQCAQERELRVVEDACQAPGATVQGQPAGSWGDASVLSFGGSKLLTAGRGGAVACRQVDVYQRMTVWADRGNDAFPMSQLQAAVLQPQLAALDEHNAKRQENGAAISAKLHQTEGLYPIWHSAGNDDRPAGYKFGLWLCPEHFDKRRCEHWIAAIQAEGIAIDRGFRGFTRRSERRCRKPGPLVHAERASQFGVVLHHPVLLKDREIVKRLCDAIHRATIWVN